MAEHAHAGIGRQYTLQAESGFTGAICHYHHAGMLGIADAHASTIVDADPGGARRRVHQRVQQRPIGDRIRAVQHALGLTIRRGDRSGVKMVAANHDRRRNFAGTHQLVHRQTQLRPLAVAQPADASRQTLEVNALASQLDPAFERFVSRKER